MEFLKEPWPWYVSGPLIGLIVPLLLIFANKQIGISSSLRHICAAVVPGKIKFFQYDWKAESWNLFFVAGIFIGGMIGSLFLSEDEIDISAKTIAELKALGIDDIDGIMPSSIFAWDQLFSIKGLVFIIIGGFLVGFGTRYAGGCTSGHAIMGLSNLQLPSLVAVIGFFIGGLIMTHLLLPLII